jgi:hypothetical protein
VATVVAAPFLYELALAMHAIRADKRPIMFARLLIFLTLVLVPASAFAQSIEGTWDFRIDGTTIFRFDIEQGDSGEWSGQWSRPGNFNTDGNSFANMGEGVKTTSSMTGILFEGQVELSFDDPRPGAIPDIFRFTLLEDDRAEMLYVGTDLAPYILVRARDGDSFGNWQAGRIYSRNVTASEGSVGENSPGITDDFLDGL